MTGILLTLSMIGMALMIKWVNRTLDAVWHQNALPLVIVSAWWIRQFSAGWQPSFRRAAGATAAVATILALLLVQDENNPHLYGLRSYATYPSLLRWPFVSSPPVTWQEDLDQITETETKFIQEKPGQTRGSWSSPSGIGPIWRRPIGRHWPISCRSWCPLTRGSWIAR